MSNKGYGLEHYVEQSILKKSKQDLSISLFHRTYRVPSSGAIRGEKGDVKTNIPWKFDFQFMIECKDRKCVNKKDGYIFRLNLNWVTKNVKEAIEDKRKPLFVFAFKGSKTDRVWCLFLKTDYFLLFKNPVIKTDIKIKRKSLVLVKNKIKNFMLLLNEYVLVNFDLFLKVIEENLK